MSTDKTLADVQPGGRVRLGGQRSDLVPGIVRCAKCAFQLHRTNLYLQSGTVGAGDSKTEPCPNGCGPLWPVTWETWAREGWAEAERLHLENAALSAQPSPGGQDELKALVARWRAEAAAHELNGLEADSIGLTVAAMRNDARHHVLEAAADELEAALAARQPVTMDDALAAGDGTLHGAIDHWQERALRAEAEPAARQPVGEPVELARAKVKIAALELQLATYEAPAQAVDLANVIEQIAQQWDGCSYDAVGETIDIGQAIRAAGKRLADSQAVGNK